MKWLHTKPKPIEGQRRERFPFAWKPTRVKQYMVWLERYWVWEQYVNGEWMELSRDIPHYY